MSYYWFNIEKLLKKMHDKYHDKGGKERAAQYYSKNADLIRLEARSKYRSLPEKKRIKKRNIKEKDITRILI